MLVSEIQNKLAVEVVFDVVAFCDDNNVVPVVDFHQFFETGLIDQRIVDHFFAVFGPDCFFADQADTPTLATFVVDERRNVGEVFFVAEFVLVTFQDPIVANAFARLKL